MNHLSLIKSHYCISQKLGVNGKWVFEALIRKILDLQNSLLKLTMKGQLSKAMIKPKDKNSMTKV